ncbi:hypothetical protein [Bosea sp. NPDC055594]
MAGPIEPPSKSFTSQKLDLQKRMCADRRVTDGQYRMFTRVLANMNEGTGIAIISDEAIIAEVASCGSQSTCKANRKKLAELGYWTVKPGSGASTSEYKVDLKAGMALMAGLEEQRRQRISRRRQKHSDWRARKRADRHGDVGQTVMQDPPYTLYTPSTETPSYRATEESRYLQGAEDNLLIPKSVLSLLGGGDVAEGRRLAEVVPPDRLAEILDFASKFGASACRGGIAEARDLALSILARRASA